MTKCEHCPASGRCVVDWTQHRRFCEHAASGDPEWRQQIVELSEAGPPPPGPPWPPSPDEEGGNSEPVYPPLMTQAANALGSAARFVASGGATVSQEEYDRRKAICRACPTNRYVAAENRCEACGCYLAVKPWGKAERCPDGHW